MASASPASPRRTCTTTANASALTVNGLRLMRSSPPLKPLTPRAATSRSATSNGRRSPPFGSPPNGSPPLPSLKSASVAAWTPPISSTPTRPSSPASASTTKTGWATTSPLSPSKKQASCAPASAFTCPMPTRLPPSANMPLHWAQAHTATVKNCVWTPRQTACTSTCPVTRVSCPTQPICTARTNTATSPPPSPPLHRGWRLIPPNLPLPAPAHKTPPASP